MEGKSSSFLKANSDVADSSPTRSHAAPDEYAVTARGSPYRPAPRDAPRSRASAPRPPIPDVRKVRRDIRSWYLVSVVSWTPTIVARPALRRKTMRDGGHGTTEGLVFAGLPSWTFVPFVVYALSGGRIMCRLACSGVSSVMDRPPNTNCISPAACRGSAPKPPLKC